MSLSETKTRSSDTNVTDLWKFTREDRYVSTEPVEKVNGFFIGFHGQIRTENDVKQVNLWA